MLAHSRSSKSAALQLWSSIMLPNPFADPAGDAACVALTALMQCMSAESHLAPRWPLPPAAANAALVAFLKEQGCSSWTHVHLCIADPPAPNTSAACSFIQRRPSLLSPRGRARTRTELWLRPVPQSGTSTVQAALARLRAAASCFLWSSRLSPSLPALQQPAHALECRIQPPSGPQPSLPTLHQQACASGCTAAA